MSAGGTDEPPPRISVIDVVTLVTGKDARKTARDFGFVKGRYPEVAQNLGLSKFPRKRPSETRPWQHAVGSCNSLSCYRGVVRRAFVDTQPEEIFPLSRKTAF